ncbi:MAG: hypothetical protein JXR37_16470 [Kiritimatiellae bacterium]|nr:hypothetical protein [Kiritimatiellia bacterium]
MIRVPTTELARHLGDYLARVRYGGETVVVLKNRTPIAELRGMRSGTKTLREFIDIWKSTPADAGFADDLSAVNAADRPLENPWD